MKFTYSPSGVCSRKIDFELENNKVKNVVFTGGCAGNLTGISHLVEGMEAEHAIARIKGIPCGMKATSCPDQLAVALEAALSKAKAQE